MRPDAPARAYLEPARTYRQSSQLCLRQARDLLEAFSLSDFLSTLLESTADEIFKETYQYLHLGLLVPPGIDESLFHELLTEIAYNDHRRIFPSEVMTLELSGLNDGGKVSTTIYKAFRKPDHKGVRGVELFSPQTETERAMSWIEQGVGAHLGIGLKSREAVIRATKLCAEAVCAAARIEGFMPIEYDEPDPAQQAFDEEQYEITYPKLKWGLRKLEWAFPELDVGPMLAHASQHHTRPCPCGRGVLAKWPWVVQTADLGFCDCDMASWELICWRSEWIARWPKLGW